MHTNKRRCLVDINETSTQQYHIIKVDIWMKTYSVLLGSYAVSLDKYGKNSTHPTKYLKFNTKSSKNKLMKFKCFCMLLLILFLLLND